MFRKVNTSFKDGKDSFVAGEVRFFPDEDQRKTLEGRGWIGDSQVQQTTTTQTLDIHDSYSGFTSEVI